MVNLNANKFKLETKALWLYYSIHVTSIKNISTRVKTKLNKKKNMHECKSLSQNFINLVFRTLYILNGLVFVNIVEAMPFDTQSITLHFSVLLLNCSIKVKRFLYIWIIIFYVLSVSKRTTRCIAVFLRFNLDFIKLFHFTLT